MVTKEVFFATNRNFIGEREVFGPGFQDHPDFFRIGTATVSIESDNAELHNVWIAEEVIDRDQQTGVPYFSKVGSQDVYPKIVEALRARNAGCLVFIPGFNYSFRESLYRAAQLSVLYSTPTQQLVPFVFSWPSNGSLSRGDYIADRRDAELSGMAMARAFFAFVRIIRRMHAEQRCGAPIHLIAHSMGVYALRHAVVRIFGHDAAVRPFRLFDSVILAAGDDESDTLSHDHKLAKIRFLTKRLDIYFNRNDKPVQISDDIDTDIDRLGAFGPSDRSIIDHFGIPVSLIDCRNVDAWTKDMTRHQYYRLSEVVVEDIRDVLAGHDDSLSIHRREFDAQGRAYVLRHPSAKQISAPENGAESHFPLLETSHPLAAAAAF